MFSKEKFNQYVADIKAKKSHSALGASPLVSVTISRQAGARGERTAYALKAYLEAKKVDLTSWQVFDSSLVDIILDGDFLGTKELNVEDVKAMPENKVSLLYRWMRIIRRKPTDVLLFQRTKKAIAALLDLGHCVIVGRGAEYLSSQCPQVLKVKLLVGKTTAVRRLAKDYKLKVSEAEVLWKVRNKERNDYIKTYYGKNPKDLSVYDLVIDTDDLRVVEVAEIIGNALLERMKSPIEG